MTSIPAFHVSSSSKAKGKGLVFISTRKDAASSGEFSIAVNVQFNPAIDSYPVGSVEIKTNMSDSFKGLFSSTSIELINSHGKHNPTVFLTGRCKTTSKRAPMGLRYWVMIADNGNNKTGTPDVVGFTIHDRDGNRIAYGTGPLKSGSFVIAPK